MLNMKILRNTCLFLIGLLLLAAEVSAGLVVIVHPDNPTDDLTPSQIKQLFLGKVKTFPNGQRALPVELKRGHLERLDFVDRLLNRSETQLKAYWSRLIFTGKGKPPKIALSPNEMIHLVSQNPLYIGYVEDVFIDESVKVVYTLE